MVSAVDCCAVVADSVLDSAVTGTDVEVSPAIECEVEEGGT